MKGSSIEFRQHRFYVPGDEPRRLDWRVLARTDRPYIKEYDEETNLRCLLLLDSSGSMRYSGKFGSKFDYACKLVAALAYLMLGQTESVGLGVMGSKLDKWLSPRTGAAQLSRIMEALDGLAPAGKAALAQSLHEAANRLGRRALVVVVSDFFSPVSEIRTGLARLHHDRHEIIALQVLDQDEIQFPYMHLCRLRGMEGEGHRLCEPALVRKTYLTNFEKHQEGLREIGRLLGIESVRFTTDQEIGDGLRAFLHRRMK